MIGLGGKREGREGRESGGEVNGGGRWSGRGEEQPLPVRNDSSTLGHLLGSLPMDWHVPRPTNTRLGGGHALLCHLLLLMLSFLGCIWRPSG